MYQKAFDMLLAVAYAKKNVAYGVKIEYYGFDLSGTPLIGATLASRQIIDAFKAKHKLDIVNAIHLTDGEATDNLKGSNGYYLEHGLSEKDKNYILRVVDPITKQTVDMKLHSHTKAHTITGFIGQITGSKMIGIYIGKKADIGTKLSSLNAYYTAEEIAAMKKSFESTNFCSAPVSGYDQYFFIKQEANTVSNADYTVSSDDKLRKMASTFSKAQTSKKSARLYVTKFMEQIV
jgi:hypothetical protein